MPILKRQVDSASSFVSPFSFMKDNSSVLFSSGSIYFVEKEPIKWKLLRLSSAQVKIKEISDANFETTSRFLSKFCIPLQLHERLFLCTFLTQTIYTLLIKSPLK